jgi:hypothetical protein
MQLLWACGWPDNTVEVHESLASALSIMRSMASPAKNPTTSFLFGVPANVSIIAEPGGANAAAFEGEPALSPARILGVASGASVTRFTLGAPQNHIDCGVEAVVDEDK